MSVHYIYYKDGAKMMRPVQSREEYMALRGTEHQQRLVRAVRAGNSEAKQHLLQMNYSCLPNGDGSLRGSKAMSTTIGMDIDHIEAGEMEAVKERILQKKEELGLLMLEESARGQGYHLVFRRKTGLSQEENLQWASQLLGVEFDKGAKDITRVFFTTSAAELLYLDDEIFSLTPSPSPQGRGENVNDDVITENRDNELENPSTSKAPLAFRGVAYDEIIREYWSRTGGEPQEGERNVKLHKLAVNLRAICDNRREVLMAVMPRFGLSETELKSIVDSACKEEPKGISKLVESIVKERSETPEDSENTVTPEDSERKNAVNVRTLPIGLKESLAGVPAPMHLPVLCSVLPIAAAYADQVEVEYCDGNRQRLGLMSIIRGEQASGKSVCKLAVDVWKRQFDKEDALARKREEEWKEQKKGRKANEKAPEDPHVLIRMVPVTVSCSTLLKRFKNAQGHTLYSFGEELDTLRKTNGAGSWSSKYDIYRVGFDNGEWGQDYNSDQAESGVVRVAYNWTMLGTDGALRKCFRQDNIENGLSSRVLVSAMPDSSFSRMPKFVRRSPEEEARIQEAVTKLRSFSGFIDTPRLRKAIEAWVEEKRVEAAKDIDHVKDTYRKRAAVIGFRCGVVFHLLTGRNKESKACLDFARMMADYTLTEQTAAFGEALMNQYTEARSECQRYGANHSVFDQLPPVFTVDDLRALKRGSLPRNSLIKIISRWNLDGWVEKTDQKHWRKLVRKDSVRENRDIVTVTS